MRSVHELFRVDGRVAVITGGAGHLGGAFGEALAEQGAHVVVVDLEQGACDERAEALASTATTTLAGDAARAVCVAQKRGAASAVLGFALGDDTERVVELTRAAHVRGRFVVECADSLPIRREPLGEEGSHGCSERFGLRCCGQVHARDVTRREAPESP